MISDFVSHLFHVPYNVKSAIKTQTARGIGVQLGGLQFLRKKSTNIKLLSFNKYLLCDLQMGVSFYEVCICFVEKQLTKPLPLFTHHLLQKHIPILQQRPGMAALFLVLHLSLLLLKTKPPSNLVVLQVQ